MAAEPTTVLLPMVEELISRYPIQAASELERLAPDTVAAFVREVGWARAASMLDRFRTDFAALVLACLEEDDLPAIIAAMDPARAAAIIRRRDPGDRDRLLATLEVTSAKELSELLTYPPDSAGAMMDSRVNCFRADSLAGEALDRLRALGHQRINNLHVVDDDGVFKGSVRLQDLAVANPDRALEGLLAGAPVAVSAMAPSAEAAELFEQQRLTSVPVVDFHGRLIGLIRQPALVDAVEAEATADIQAMVGASRDERALSPVLFAVKKRLPWLQINLATAFLASFVVGLFEDTIARFTALAVLLPVVAGQSGNTGAQALAVTMRGLALREIRTRQAARIAVKESLVAFINGVAVAVVTSAAVYLWSRSYGLAAVIGIAMVLSMLIAGLAGAVIPVILTVLGQDPAQASSIVLTTVTDVAGFLSFLGLATLAAGYL